MRRRHVSTARLGLRLARREVWRRPWRSALVLVMVLVPVVAMTMVAIYLRTTEYTRSGYAAAQYGAADATATTDGSLPTADQLQALKDALPARSRVREERTMADRAGAGDRRSYFTASDMPVDAPIASGRFGGLRGRPARTSSEAVVSDEVAHDLGLDVGDTFLPERLGRSLRVVGIIRPRVHDIVVVDRPSGTDGQVFVGARLADSSFVDSTVLVDLPGHVRPGRGDGSAPPGVRPAAGWNIYSVPAYDEIDQTSGVFFTYVGGAVALVVFATVITAAFAIGARRQFTAVGLLSATGASPTTIMWFLVAQGALLGVIGSLAGVVTGVALASQTPQRWLDGLDIRPDGMVVHALDLVPIVLLGTLVAAVAAWIPARTVARIPTLQALAGRRPLGRVPPRLPMLGMSAIALGCGLFAVSVAALSSDTASGLLLIPIAGGVAVLMGAVAIAPWAIDGIGRVSARWPNAWRLAGRSLGRSRVRSSAVVGAACVAAIVVIAGTSLYASNDSDTSAQPELPQLRPNQIVLEMSLPFGQSTAPVEVLDRVRAVVPDAQVVPITDLAPGGPFLAPGGPSFASYVSKENPDNEIGFRAGIATPEVLDALRVPTRLRAALGHGDAVSVVRPPFTTDAVRIRSPRGITEVRLGASFDSPTSSMFLPGVLLSRARAEALGFSGVPSPFTFLEARRSLTVAQRARLGLLANDLLWEFDAENSSPTSLNIDFDKGNVEIPESVVMAVLLGIALLFVLSVIGVGLALAARDSEDEYQVLSAVGAPPRTLRRVGALRGVLLALSAAVIAIPAGLGSSAAIVAAAGEGSFRVDWVALGFVLVVIPAVVGGVALAGGRLRDVLRPTRPEAFTFVE